MASDNPEPDPLLNLLLPHIPPDDIPPRELSTSYLNYLTSLPLSAIQNTEPATLAATSHSTNHSLQSLASRSHRNIIASAAHLDTLSSSVSQLQSSLTELKSSLPALDQSITSFITTYSRESEHLAKRQKARTLHTNLEKLLDILHLPSLLSSHIATANYPSALDTLAHVRRLCTLYPESKAIKSVSSDCEQLQETLITNLVNTLRGPLKLPVAMKTVGFLRRTSAIEGGERELRAVFLVCRVAYLNSLLNALEPLRKIADDDKNGVNTERYLKRWLEIFREHSFGILSMYRSIFPSAVRGSGASSATSGTATPPLMGRHSRNSSSFSSTSATDEDPDGGPPPDPVVGFVPTLVDMLVKVLKEYLPKIEDKGTRESLLTQVLYASESLARLGGDFSIVLLCEGVFVDEEEYVAVVERQRILKGKLEAMGRQ